MLREQLITKWAELKKMIVKHQQELTQLKTCNSSLSNQLSSLNSQTFSLTSQLNSLKVQLQKEQNWLDKWMNDRGKSLISLRGYLATNQDDLLLKNPSGTVTSYSSEKVIPHIKQFYQYYRDK